MLEVKGDSEEEDSNSLDEDGDAFVEFEGCFNLLDKEDVVEDPSKLIDFDLVNLLKFCHDLHRTYKFNNDEYQNYLVDKSFELGMKTRQKVLIFDMDETLVAAKFASRTAPGFQSSFEFDYHGQTILVRKRPYL